MKKDILSCKLDELEVALTEMGEKKFRTNRYMSGYILGELRILMK